MSEQELTAEAVTRSSVTITVNAKGSRQWQVKVYALSDEPEAVAAARDLATQVDASLAEQYGLPA
jgi:hypothetical protein